MEKYREERRQLQDHCFALPADLSSRLGTSTTSTLSRMRRWCLSRTVAPTTSPFPSTQRSSSASSTTQSECNPTLWFIPTEAIDTMKCFIHVHTHAHTCAHMRTHAHTHAHMHTHAHTCTHTCTHAHTCTHMHAHTHARMVNWPPGWFMIS